MTSMSKHTRLKSCPKVTPASHIEANLSSQSERRMESASSGACRWRRPGHC